ncbi:hypothetical protein GCM10007382_23840 [Salinibacterium xinjiangense]|nr:hypothetical protein GCM10007382_23840 [Salinibacterium xinjiangense]
MPAPIMDPRPMATASPRPSLRASAGRLVKAQFQSRGQWGWEDFCSRLANGSSTAPERGKAPVGGGEGAKNPAIHGGVARHRKAIVVHPVQGEVGRAR